jgi:hypothetical protein
MVHRPMPPSIQWGAATIVRADWRRRSCFQPGCLPHCCRRTLHQQAEEPPDWGNNLAAHPHPVLMQRREWLRPCSMPTPRFRQSIERYRSQFVNVRSCKAGQVKVRYWRVQQWTRRGRRRGSGSSALAIYARRGTQSLHIPRYCAVALLPSYILDNPPILFANSPIRDFSWFSLRSFCSHCPFSRLTGSTLRLTINKVTTNKQPFD